MTELTVASAAEETDCFMAFWFGETNVNRFMPYPIPDRDALHPS